MSEDNGKIAKEENNLLKWLVITLLTAVVGLIVFLYNDLRTADKLQIENQMQNDRKVAAILTNIYIICQNQPKDATKCRDMPNLTSEINSLIVKK